VEQQDAPDVDALGAVMHLVHPPPDERRRVLRAVPPVAGELEDDVADGGAGERAQAGQVEQRVLLDEVIPDERQHAA
jgi:hypothetical protein